VFYLKQMSPWFGEGNHAFYAGLFVVISCAALNLAGIRVVGITSLWLFFLLSVPFALIVVLAPFKLNALGSAHAAAMEGTGLGLLGGVLVAMWTTWAGTTLRRSRRKWSGRSGRTRGR